MVYEVASFEMAAGKNKEAQDWAREIHEYSKKKFGFSGHITSEVTPGAGRGNRVTWISIYDSIGAWGQVLDKMHADPGWQELSRSHMDARIPNTFTRTAYRTL